jgi:glycosyltransferase involved in cell wall biosynthesis
VVLNTIGNGVLLKVLIYTHSFAPNVGGAETLVMLLAGGLADSLGVYGKEEITVITPTPADGFDDGSLPFSVVRRPGLIRLVRLIMGANILHLAGPCLVPLVFGLLLRKRIVIEHHCFQPICPNGLLFYGPTQMPCPGHFMAGRHYECLRCNAASGRLHSLKLWLLTFPRRWLCGFVSANVAITGWLARELRLPATVTIHCGVKERRDRVVQKGIKIPLTFAFIGRLVTTKGVHILLQAANLLRSRGLTFNLKIIGEGPERSKLEAQANALGLTDRVSFMGYLPEEGLKEALADVAVVVMPSLNGETFGLVAAENMIQGRSVVVSDIGVLSEVVGDAGLRFPPGDSEGLAACLQSILEDPELLLELQERARKRALELFKQERMVGNHLSLYRGVLSCKGLYRN